MLIDCDAIGIGVEVVTIVTARLLRSVVPSANDVTTAPEVRNTRQRQTELHRAREPIVRRRINEGASIPKAPRAGWRARLEAGPNTARSGANGLRSESKWVVELARHWRSPRPSPFGSTPGRPGPKASPKKSINRRLRPS